MELNEYIEKYRKIVDSALEDALPAETERPVDLHRAMRYSALGGGKRLRAILCIAACEASDGDCEMAIQPACSVEILHAYTLVHDDLPAMDDDDMRRGKPSTHKAFGEAAAILVGDALLTLAFENLAANMGGRTHNPQRLVLELSRAGGSLGVVAGQYEDISHDDQAHERNLLDYIHTHKTADLIRCACRMGAIAADAPPATLAALDNYGGKIGLAFQIVDDILDATQTSEALGKPSGSDESNSKMTAVNVYGLDAARNYARSLTQDAISALHPIRGDTTPLESIAQMLLDRSF